MHGVQWQRCRARIGRNGELAERTSRQTTPYVPAERTVVLEDRKESLLAQQHWGWMEITFREYSWRLKSQRQTRYKSRSDQTVALETHYEGGQKPRIWRGVGHVCEKGHKLYRTALLVSKSVKMSNVRSGLKYTITTLTKNLSDKIGFYSFQNHDVFFLY